MADTNLSEADEASELMLNAEAIARMLSVAEVTPEAGSQTDRLLEGE